MSPFQALLSTAEEESSSPLLDPVAMCSAVECRRGRECRVLSSGIPDCVCREDRVARLTYVHFDT